MVILISWPRDVGGVVLSNLTMLAVGEDDQVVVPVDLAESPVIEPAVDEMRPTECSDGRPILVATESDKVDTAISHTNTDAGP